MGAGSRRDDNKVLLGLVCNSAILLSALLPVEVVEVLLKLIVHKLFFFWNSEWPGPQGFLSLRQEVRAAPGSEEMEPF